MTCCVELAELRVRSENVGATVAIEKFSWKRVKQGISAPSTIILAFIFGFNNVTVQYVALVLAYGYSSLT